MKVACYAIIGGIENLPEIRYCQLPTKRNIFIEQFHRTDMLAIRRKNAISLG